MRTGRDIDKIYRDRLKGAKMTPPQDAWDNILSHLPQKEEKKRVFPFWLKLSGIAAALALLLTVSSLPGDNNVDGIPVTPVGGKLSFDFDFSEVSADFEEVMQESNILLQALILQSPGKSLQADKETRLAAVEVGREQVISEDASEEVPVLKEKFKGKDQAFEVASEEKEILEDTAGEEIAEVNNILERDEPEEMTSEKEKSEGKFRVSTKIAPVFFNSFGKGNAIDNSFTQRGVAGEVTMSYGVNIAYEISEKISIRSGINKVDLAYNTPDVAYQEVAATNSFDANLMESKALALPSGGKLSQEMGFFEVPLEVEYRVLNKKFALGIIGGGSALFLDENQVSVETFGKMTDIAETNSTSNFSFTTNLGLSLGYDVSRHLELSLEPVVKLHMNTFRNSENTSPYFFGIYSGFNYRF